MMGQLSGALLYLTLVGFGTSAIFLYAYKHNQQFPTYRSRMSTLTWGIRFLIISIVMLMVYLFTV